MYLVVQSSEDGNSDVTTFEVPESGVGYIESMLEQDSSLSLRNFDLYEAELLKLDVVENAVKLRIREK